MESWGWVYLTFLAASAQALRTGGQKNLRSAHCARQPQPHCGQSMKFIKQLIPWHRLDWMLLLCLAGLMVFGVLFVYSATYNNDLFASASWYRQPHLKQIIFYGAGIIVALIVCLKDYNLLARW